MVMFEGSFIPSVMMAIMDLAPASVMRTLVEWHVRNVPVTTTLDQTAHKVGEISKAHAVDSLTLVLLNLDLPCLCKRVDPDQLASSEANWSGSALFVIKYVNLYK